MNQSRYFSDIYEGTRGIAMDEYAHSGRVLLALKATEGIGHVDVIHKSRTARAHAYGLTVLHYHFARPDDNRSPADEAGHFAREVKPVLRPGDYLCLDIERFRPEGSATTVAWCEQFCTLVHGYTGHSPIVYASESVLAAPLAPLRVPGERYWVAKYGPGPVKLARRRHLFAWQYTDGAVGPLPRIGPGIGACDNSIMSRRMGWVLRARTLRRRRGVSNKAS